MPAMAEERRLVTVLFADVVDSTVLGESLDPEDLRRLLGRFYEIARQVVDAHSGTLEKFIGDAAMAIFGLPQAHDDDARRAVAAALELCQRVREDAALGDRLPIRVGINSGEVVASRDRANQDFIVTGDAVNVAARLQQSAEPWQVLVSVRTASATRGAYAFGPPVDLQLKGKAQPVTARAVIGPSSEVGPRTPLVGRDADLAQLELVARRAFDERRPYLVSLIAPAGTGKSRLVEEFIRRLDGMAPDARVAVAQCLPYGQRLTYWPMRALLLYIVGRSEVPDGPEELRDEIRDWLQRHGSERPAETADILAATIGASDTDVLDRSALFAAWREMVELAAADQPLLLLIEDLHWSSDSLLDLIEFVLQPRADAPMLMLALTRPERRPTWGGGRRNHVSLALEPLDSGSIEHLVQDILDGPAPELLPIVVQRSEGNPFYAGEIVRSLVERGVDLRDPEAVQAAAAGLPDTVQATVLARLDALDPQSRRVLQLGSVFGRSFSAAGVQALLGQEGDADVGEAIERLIDREMLRPAGRGELVFRHILIREVAYGTLPRSERARLHGGAGAWLDAGSNGREDEMAELIAYHYREAVILGEAAGMDDPSARERAVAWLRRAAEVAGGARGIAEASAHLQAAIELASPDDLPDIYQRLGEFQGSGDRSVEAFEHAWQLGLERHRPTDFVLLNLARQIMVMCRWYASVARQPSLEEMNALIDRGRAMLPNAGRLARATFLIAASFLPFWIQASGSRPLTENKLRVVRAEAAEGIEIAEQLDEPSLLSAALDAMTSHQDPQEGRNLSDRRLALGDRINTDERQDALNMVAWMSLKLGDLRRATEAAEAAVTEVQPGQTPGFALGGASWRAYAAALVGGSWTDLVLVLDENLRRWVNAERPAASYALQGFLSGIDWARNRGEIEILERWRDVAMQIIGRFAAEHPVAALRAVVDLDLDGVAEIVARYERYPVRTHYVEHALAICADHRQAVPRNVLGRLVESNGEPQDRILRIQALRLRGVLERDADDLRASLDALEQMGADRYAARVRLELGEVTADEAMVARARAELDRFEELVALDRMRGRTAGPS
jgi:class 3 adenylate cyclase